RDRAGRAWGKFSVISKRCVALFGTPFIRLCHSMFALWPWLTARARGVIAPAMRDWIEKISRVRRLTPGALAICENTIRLQRHSREIVMGSGAYAVFIDQQAPGGGPPGSLRRVVPLPPPELSGGVKFTTVVLSLAYDNFGEAGAPATIPATVRVLRGSGPVQTLNVTIEVGRKFFHFFHADD